MTNHHKRRYNNNNNNNNNNNSKNVTTATKTTTVTKGSLTTKRTSDPEGNKDTTTSMGLKTTTTTTDDDKAVVTTPLPELPEEILLRICSFLSALDLLRVSCVCSLWRQIARDDCLWRVLFKRDFQKDFVPKSSRTLGAKAQRKKRAQTKKLMSDEQMPWWQKYIMKNNGYTESEVSRLVNLSIQNAQDRLQHSVIPRNTEQARCLHPSDSIYFVPPAFRAAKTKMFCKKCDLAVGVQLHTFETEVRLARKEELKGSEDKTYQLVTPLQWVDKLFSLRGCPSDVKSNPLSKVTPWGYMR
eukprot:TRINITY_DN2394_c0_g1_i1.p1 TRINITY_DN2394_c0_g1~~TRINITY_DN2394_c0_g1_i1.p1  ORF type:complete len:311 (+),score=58.01 TRINITY_DN2394_c0_g1_i1:38-934(+)